MNPLAGMGGEFAAEAFGLLDRAEKCVAALEGDLPPEAREALRGPIRRHLHTLKGNAGFIGARPLQDALHRLEALEETMGQSPEAATGLLRALGILRDEVEEIGRGRTPSEGSAAVTRLAEAAGWSAIEGVGSAAVSASASVSQALLDDLIATSSDLWVQHAQLAGQVARIPEARWASERLTAVVRRLQLLALSMRLQTFRGALARLERIVAEESTRAGKQARLVTEGSGVEVDKGVLDASFECLVHLVRNAIAHGVEAPRERISRGKAPTGTISVSVAHHADLIRITVADDGAGLDLEAIRRRAEKAGMDPRRAPEALIFEPGFTTATVGTLSGRGVGLDAVRAVVGAAGGTVEVASTPFAGCSFTLAIPTSLALQRALVVTVGEERYALPASAVFRTARSSELPHRLLGGRRWIDHGGRLIPVVDAARVLGVAPRSGGYTVLFDAGGLAALEVDQLSGHQEMVFRPLESAWSGAAPVSGATLAASGAVLLRLDPWRLVASTSTAPSPSEATPG